MTEPITTLFSYFTQWVHRPIIEFHRSKHHTAQQYPLWFYPLEFPSKLSSVSSVLFSSLHCSLSLSLNSKPFHFPSKTLSLSLSLKMASINFNNPFENWFNKPQNPISPINLLSLTQSISPKQTPPNFASISNPFKSKKPKPQPRNPDEPGPMRQMVDQFFWECENIPDYRHTPEVEKILNSDPIFEHKENPTPEEIRENEEFWARFRASPVVQFLARAEEIADQINEMELKENDTPYRREDKKLWQAVPHVIGLDGRPMVRKAIKTKKESDDKFWDFARQFFFGLWGFRQRPYPPGRPIDVAQAVGYKRLEKRYYDCKCLNFWVGIVVHTLNSVIISLFSNVRHKIFVTTVYVTYTLLISLLLCITTELWCNIAINDTNFNH